MSYKNIVSYIVTLIYDFTFLDALCNQFTQCNYWTWKGLQLGRQCWLKTSDAGSTQQNGAFSGPKGCSLGK